MFVRLVFVSSVRRVSGAPLPPAVSRRRAGGSGGGLATRQPPGQGRRGASRLAPPPTLTRVSQRTASRARKPTPASTVPVSHLRDRPWCSQTGAVRCQRQCYPARIEFSVDEAWQPLQLVAKSGSRAFLLETLCVVTKVNRPAMHAERATFCGSISLAHEWRPAVRLVRLACDHPPAMSSRTNASVGCVRRLARGDGQLPWS